MMASKRYYREDVIVPCYYYRYKPEVELIDNGGGLEFRTRFTNIVSTQMSSNKFNVIQLIWTILYLCFV